jgi:hypothetical protein
MRPSQWDNLLNTARRIICLIIDKDCFLDTAWRFDFHSDIKDRRWNAFLNYQKLNVFNFKAKFTSYMLIENIYVRKLTSSFRVPPVVLRARDNLRLELWKILECACSHHLHFSQLFLVRSNKWIQISTR